ncbi:unnamed protein product [Clavelina lepadiformis]|uniref:Uncharacterized protein n=1 Tax=Clavelina lepadiformis TaxID=159417 RepID=A0ABP0F677_CLALP
MMFVKAGLAVSVAFIVLMVIRGGKKRVNPADVKALRVVITGASSGIGEEISYQLAAMGAKLLVTARRESKLKNVIEKCKNLGSQNAMYIAASMDSLENASRVITEAKEKLGEIDMLILNHINPSRMGGFCDNLTAQEIETKFVANVLANVHMTALAMESLKANLGRILYVSSFASVGGTPFLLPYVTHKSAMNGFFQGLRQELKYNNTDVSVSVCFLGYIGTEKAKAVQKSYTVKPSPVDECAKEMIRGAMAREDNVYYPSVVSWAAKLQGLLPQYMEYIVRSTVILP